MREIFDAGVRARGRPVRVGSVAGSGLWGYGLCSWEDFVWGLHGGSLCGWGLNLRSFRGRICAWGVACLGRAYSTIPGKQEDLPSLRHGLQLVSELQLPRPRVVSVWRTGVMRKAGCPLQRVMNAARLLLFTTQCPDMLLCCSCRRAFAGLSVFVFRLWSLVKYNLPPELTTSWRRWQRRWSRAPSTVRCGAASSPARRSVCPGSPSSCCTSTVSSPWRTSSTSWAATSSSWCGRLSWTGPAEHPDPRRSLTRFHVVWPICRWRRSALQCKTPASWSREAHWTLFSSAFHST